MSIKLSIADDEPLLRDQMARMLKREWPEAHIVSMTGNGIETRQAITAHRPEVAFLDIRMPPPDGLELAEEFATDLMRVVFVTAYNEYAVEAFEKHAFDYLLKPVSQQRLRATIDRLKQGLELSVTADMVRAVRAEIAHLEGNNQLTRLPVTHQGATKFIDVADIRYFKSDAKYTVAYDAEHEYVLSTPLKDLEKKLNNRDFLRIHRNCLVNANFIDVAIRGVNDSLHVRLKDLNVELSVSRAHRYLFRAI